MQFSQATIVVVFVDNDTLLWSGLNRPDDRGRWSQVEDLRRRMRVSSGEGRILSSPCLLWLHQVGCQALRGTCVGHGISAQLQDAAVAQGLGTVYIVVQIYTSFPQISSHLRGLSSSGPCSEPVLGARPSPGSGRHIHSLIQPGTSSLE